MHSNDEIWNCDRARRAIVDALMDPNKPNEAALGSHLAGCAACRAERADSVALWASLGTLPSPKPDPRARERFGRAIAAYVAGRERASVTPVAPALRRATRPLAIAAAVVIAALVGYGSASWTARQSPLVVAASVADSAPRFLLLLHENESMQNGHTPGAQAAIVAEYRAWAEGLRARGELVVAEKLSDDRTPWLGAVAGGSQPDGSGDHVSGFFVIRARDYAAARRIAEACPHLRHGGRIELRAIQRT